MYQIDNLYFVNKIFHLLPLENSIFKMVKKSQMKDLFNSNTQKNE